MHCFITGFPDLLARLLADRIAQFAPGCTLSLLVPPTSLQEAEVYCQELRGVSAKLLTGDVVDMHLGLSGDEYRELCLAVTDIFHLATVSQLGVPRSTARKVNVDGARNLLELARECSHLTRLNYLSSSYVAGDRIGVIAEDELDRGQGFRHAQEEMAYLGEKTITVESENLPLTIYRPSSVVGNSRTGETDRFDGPFYLGLYWLLSPFAATVPLPGEGAAPLNLVPADFVAEAIWAISQDPDGAGRTVHVVDAQPMSARRVFESVAEQLGRKLPKFFLSARAADVMLRLPLIEKWARPHRAAIHHLSQFTFYNCQNLLELLEGTGIRCPPLSAYLDKLTRFFQESHRKEPGEAIPLEDPLDPAPQSRVF